MVVALMLSSLFSTALVSTAAPDPSYPPCVPLSSEYECAFARVCVHLCECACVCASLPVHVGVCVCVSRYRIIDIVEGIDFTLMQKRLLMLKVMSKMELPLNLRTICPRCATYAADLPRPPIMQRSTAQQASRAHAASCMYLNPLSSDVLRVHAQVNHIIDHLAPIMICTVAALILLGLVLFVPVSWFAP